MKTFILTILLTFSLQLQAQQYADPQTAYSQAESDYNLGRFQQSLQTLNSNMPRFNGQLLQRAYRLASLCYLAQDSVAKTEQMVRLLLKENPYYTSVQDPVRFEEMVNRMKTGHTTTITTASSKVESITEAPVPVTIITRKMIDNLSYNKSLNAILAAYVPGFTEVAAAGMDNIAVHGIYTSGQEKILIMENGHRLNARSTNAGKFDYAISTEKIDHIEVLRGPASSLYGNVALTAVVNIITRNGAEVGGLNVKYGAADYRTHKADLLFGNSIMGADVLVWGSIYTSKGKDVFIPAGTGFTNSQADGYATIGRYDGKPSYDLGASIRLNDFSIMMSSKYGKQSPQYTLYGETYDFSRYRTLQGLTPGLSITSRHLELDYARQLGKVHLDMAVTGDWYKFADYTVLSDSILFTRYTTHGTPQKNADGTNVKEVHKGLSQKTDWDEYTLGGTIKADMDYRIGSMTGNILVGMQMEFFALTNTDYYLGENYDEVELVMPEKYNAIDIGKERSTSVFFQAKHYITSHFIVNAGLRYDRKHRMNDKIIKALSPRIALIYAPSQEFSTKLSFARSFVDAPFFYRQNKTNTYSGGENLMPEYMNAVQLDILGYLGKWHLNYDVNIFYNHLTEIINNTQKVGESTSAKYRNSGTLKTWGIELMLAYNNKSLEARLNTTYQHALSAEDYYLENGYIFSVPRAIANLNVAKRLLAKGKHSLWATANAGYTSRTYNRINERRNPQQPTFFLDANVIADLGLRYQMGKRLQISLDVENLFDKKYYTGGTTHFPYQRMGRMAMGTIAVHL